MSKEEKAAKIVFDNLESLPTYEAKHEYLTTTVLKGKHGDKKIGELLDRYPGVKDSVNAYMLNTAISDYSNPADEGFTFSRDVSNKKILDTMNLINLNQQIIEDKYGGDEGFDEMTLAVKNQNKRIKELKAEKANLLEGLKARKKEHDERMGWKLAGPPSIWGLEAIPATIMFEGTNIIQQLAAGWTDIGKEEGMQKIERANLVWDDENKRFGYGPEFKAQQDKVKSIESALDELSAMNQEYQDYKELNDDQDKRLKLLGSTIIDDLISSEYATEDEIRTLLGE
jgi:hypothetical protein